MRLQRVESLPKKLRAAHGTLKFITAFIHSVTGPFPELDKSILDCSQKGLKVNQPQLLYMATFYIQWNL
jgi:hypothetical protein